jgi:hypothetical protein
MFFLREQLYKLAEERSHPKEVSDFFERGTAAFMSLVVCSHALAAICPSTVLASTQVPLSRTEMSNASYTSSVAYSAASNGKLSSIPELPFSAKGAGQLKVVE